MTAVILLTAAYELAPHPSKASLPTGTFDIRFSCNHSVVTARASVVCSDSNSTSVTLNATGFDSCTGSSCRLKVMDGALTGYIFSNWTAGGDTFLGTSGSGCSDSQVNRSYSVTACVTVSGSATQYNGSLQANVV